MVPRKEPPFQDPMLPREIVGLERFHSTLRNICEGSYLWVSLRLDVMALSLRSLRSGRRCLRRFIVGHSFASVLISWEAW